MLLKESLQNGVTLVAEHVPHVRSVSVGVFVKQGSRDEPEKFSGLSHFIEHLLFKGTKNRNAKDIAVALDMIGGYCDAFTSREYTGVFVQASDFHIETVFELLSDILHNSLFDDNDVQKEKRVILEEIKMCEDLPDEFLYDLFFKVVWKGHLLGNPIQGTVKSVNNIKSKTIKEMFPGLYRPSQIILAVAGSFNKKKLIDFSNRYFCFDNVRDVKKNNSPSRKKPQYTPDIFIKRKSLEQAHFCLGFPGVSQTSEMRFAKYLLNLILGGSISSRLFQKIREDRGLAYNIYSFYSSFTDTGIFGVYAGASPDNIEEIVKLVMDELEDIAVKGVKDKELKIAKEHLKGNYLLSLESMNSRMTKLAKQELYFGKFSDIDEIMKNIDAVTIEDIKRFVSAVYRKDKLSLAGLGPIKRNIRREMFL